MAYISNLHRLTYNRKTLKLLVEVPSHIHEKMIRIIDSGLNKIDFKLEDDIPGELWSYSTVYSGVSTKTMEFVLDYTKVVANGFTFDKQMAVIGEVAFSQTGDDSLERLKAAVEAYPEVLMVIMATIDESPSYHSPKYDSAASRILCQEDSVRSEVDFISSCPNLLTVDSRNRPTNIVVAGHCWCSISRVHLQVWVRSTEPIDIDINDPTLMAHGVSLINAHCS